MSPIWHDRVADLLWIKWKSRMTFRSEPSSSTIPLAPQIPLLRVVSLHEQLSQRGPGRMAQTQVSSRFSLDTQKLCKLALLNIGFNFSLSPFRQQHHLVYGLFLKFLSLTLVSTVNIGGKNLKIFVPHTYIYIGSQSICIYTQYMYTYLVYVYILYIYLIYVYIFSTALYRFSDSFRGLL